VVARLEITPKVSIPRPVTAAWLVAETRPKV
jgi:hypothetical protein